MERNMLIYCADVIVRYESRTGPLVLVERLSSVRGLALPGGKQENGEFLSETAVREFLEETGLNLFIEGVVGTRAEKERDPRGNYVSTIFTGTAHGTQRDEDGKTHVLLLEEKEILERKDEFVFDHFEILLNYFEKTKGVN